MEEADSISMDTTLASSCVTNSTAASDLVFSERNIRAFKELVRRRYCSSGEAESIEVRSSDGSRIEWSCNKKKCRRTREISIEPCGSKTTIEAGPSPEVSGRIQARIRKSIWLELVDWKWLQFEAIQRLNSNNSRRISTEVLMFVIPSHVTQNQSYGNGLSEGGA